MKKSLVLLVALCSSVAFSYTVTIDNTTNENMVVQVNYADNLLCSPDTIKVKAHEQQARQVGGCCTLPAVVFKDVQSGTVFNYFPPTTGFGLSCRSWNAKIVANGNTYEVQTVYGLDN